MITCLQCSCIVILLFVAESMQGRRYTVSIALPGSIVDNAQTKELKTYLAGQVNNGVIKW